MCWSRGKVVSSQKKEVVSRKGKRGKRVKGKREIEAELQQFRGSALHIVEGVDGYDSGF
jgi:hypothetical protein